MSSCVNDEVSVTDAHADARDSRHSVTLTSLRSGLPYVHTRGTPFLHAAGAQHPDAGGAVSHERNRWPRALRIGRRIYCFARRAGNLTARSSRPLAKCGPGTAIQRLGERPGYRDPCHDTSSIEGMQTSPLQPPQHSPVAQRGVRRHAVGAANSCAATCHWISCPTPPCCSSV